MKKAYLKAAMKTHPDRGGTPQAFQQVSIAYTILTKKLKESLKEQIQLKLDSDKHYETRWVFYHTILAAELLVIIILLFGIWWKL